MRTFINNRIFDVALYSSLSFITVLFQCWVLWIELLKNLVNFILNILYFVHAVVSLHNKYTIKLYSVHSQMYIHLHYRLFALVRSMMLMMIIRDEGWFLSLIHKSVVCWCFAWQTGTTDHSGSSLSSVLRLERRHGRHTGTRRAWPVPMGQRGIRLWLRLGLQLWLRRLALCELRRWIHWQGRRCSRPYAWCHRVRSGCRILGLRLRCESHVGPSNLRSGHPEIINIRDI